MLGAGHVLSVDLRGGDGCGGDGRSVLPEDRASWRQRPRRVHERHGDASQAHGRPPRHHGHALPGGRGVHDAGGRLLHLTVAGPLLAPLRPPARRVPAPSLQRLHGSVHVRLHRHLHRAEGPRHRHRQSSERSARGLAHQGLRGEGLRLRRRVLQGHAEHERRKPDGDELLQQRNAL